MDKFKLVSKFKPAGDQPQAIKKIVDAVKKNKKHQVLLGVTGSGKTFTMAKAIEKLNRPALIISIHSCRRCGGMNNFDGPANAYAALMSAKNGYRASSEWQAETPGSFGTWAGKGKNIPTLTLEMPNSFSTL